MIGIPIGGKARQIEMSAPADEAFARVRHALERSGKVKDVDVSELRIKGSIRYGLQTVLVKAHVEPHGEVAKVTMRAQGDDIWGGGAKKVLQRWIDAIGEGS